jgi:hypothetical protein
MLGETMKIEEHQTTIFNGDTISGEMVIRFTNVTNDDFLKYRGRIRQIVGFGNIGLHHTTITEAPPVTEEHHLTVPNGAAIETQALVNNRKEEKGAAPVAPAGTPEPKPVERLKKVKRPYLGEESRMFLKGCIGLTNTEVIKKYKLRFKNTKYFDSEIIQMFNRVHGIT